MEGETGRSRGFAYRGEAGAPPKPEHPPEEQIYTRPSNGLQQFFSAVSDFQGFPILDLAGKPGQCVGHHRPRILALLGQRDPQPGNAFGSGAECLENQSDPVKVQQFIDSTLDFEPSHFGGALLWDTLQFLSPPLLQDTVDQLHEILMPGGYMLAFFHSNERAASVPVYSYRIAADTKSIVLTTRGERRAATYLNNRAIEKLFQKFSSVKFFLTRDHLREVIVRR